MNRPDGKYFDDKSVLLVKFFISSNLSLIQLQNKYLRELLKIPLPAQLTFRQTILPKFMANLDRAIENTLQNATCMSLVSDIWTTKRMYDFNGIAACIMTHSFERKLIVIDMNKMPGNHTAEYIKESIESMVNKFEFNKAKIVATVTDEGSAYVRLFKQIPNDPGELYYIYKNILTYTYLINY